MDRSNRTTPTESLPRPLTSLIGRERELADVADLLGREEVQLVTLTGPGGVGKTRLAIEIAARVAANFPDGVWFVDHSPLSDPGQVVPAIAQAIGARGASDSIRALLSAVGRQRLLLLLDNFEQVVEAASAVAALLHDASRLSMLVTSREPLKIGGEREYPIAPLVVPVIAAGQPSDELGQLDAVRLFTERAQAVLPAFALTPDTAAQIAEICRRLDGLPLAIELAAARIKTLPPGALLARLEHRLPLLTGIRRDAPERQQTMRNAIVWSYTLLSHPEQALLHRLGVFVGGFSLDAAEAVTAVIADPESDLLRDLSSLVDKSLVRQDSDSGAEPRYLMLETIREFALEQLLASDEHEAIRAAHAVWCTALAEEWRRYGDTRHLPEMTGIAEPPLATEYDNVRAALTWLEETGDLAALARLAGAIWWYWLVHGPRIDGIRWLDLGSRVPGDTEYNKTSRLWNMQGALSLLLSHGRYDEARNAANECLHLARELAEPISEATAMAMIGYIVVCVGEYEQAAEPLRQAIELNQRIGHWRAVATNDMINGLAAYGLGRLDEAATILERSLAVHRASGDHFDLAVELNALALVRCDQGRHSEAASLLSEALPLWRDLKTQEDVSEWLAGAATLATAAGMADQAASLLAAAHALRAMVGYAFAYPERAAYERTERALREQLSPEDFARASRAGSSMLLQDALAEAARLLDQVRMSPATSDPNRRTNPFGLTSREIDVLRLLVQGQSDKEIADALFIGLRTVETHVSNLLGKLDVRNRAEATALAVRNNLV